MNSSRDGGRSGFDEEFEDEVTSVTTPPTIDARRFRQESAVRDRATLTLVTGANAGAIFTLSAEETVVGRGKECAIRIDDPGISRRHARVVRKGPGSYAVEDLASRNGTFVRGDRIVMHALAEGDRISFGPAVEMRFGFADEAEEILLRKLYESSVQDALTGAFNRKHFSERLTAEMAYARRHKTPLSLLIFDLDHFKRINDSMGHLGGDHVLRTVGALVKKTLRVEDIFARYGGEEFAIIARGIDAPRALLLAERVRIVVEQARMDFNGVPTRVTISLGVASLACCADAAGSDALVGKADERLYAAKHGGRNRSVGADPRSL